jgi:MFS family permease
VPSDDGYRWVALSNTTLGLLMATINSSIVLIALPDIFRGIGIDPLAPGNTSYLLWMIMGFLVVTAVLVVGFGRLGDMFGRVRMYNLGFLIFTVASVLLALTWQTGDAAALWLIFWRITGTWCSWCRCRSGCSARSGPTSSCATPASGCRPGWTGGATSPSRSG